MSVSCESYLHSDYYYEQWISCAYRCVGVFVRNCDELTKEDILNHSDLMFSWIKEQKSKWYPRGICAYYAIPIYVAKRHDDKLVDWVKNRPWHQRYRWAMGLEPVLYSVEGNEAYMYSWYDCIHSNFVINRYLGQTIKEVLNEVSNVNGYEKVDSFNGGEIVIDLEGFSFKRDLKEQKSN